MAQRSSAVCGESCLGATAWNPLRSSMSVVPSCMACARAKGLLPDLWLLLLAALQGAPVDLLGRAYVRCANMFSMALYEALTEPPQCRHGSHPVDTARPSIMRAEARRWVACRRRLGRSAVRTSLPHDPQDGALLLQSNRRLAAVVVRAQMHAWPRLNLLLCSEIMPWPRPEHPSCFVMSQLIKPAGTHVKFELTIPRSRPRALSFVDCR